MADTLQDNMPTGDPNSDISYGPDLNPTGLPMLHITVRKAQTASPGPSGLGGAGQPDVSAAPAATNLLATEAKNRLGLAGTPDLTDAPTKAAVMELLARQGQSTVDNENLPPPLGPAMIQARADKYQAKNEDLDSIVKNFDPSASYDPNNKMDSTRAFLIGRQLGMKNWQDADDQFHRFFPAGDMISVGGYPFDMDTNTWLYREDQNQPFKQLGTAAGVGEVANLRNVGNIASTAISPEVGLFRSAALTGLATAAGDYTDYLTNKAQGFSQNIPVEGALQRAGESGAQASIPMYALAGIFRGIPAALRLGQGVGNVVTNRLDAISIPKMVDLSNEATKQGLNPLTLGQVGPNFVQLMARQAGATSGVMKNTIFGQMNSARQLIEKQVQENPDLATNPIVLQRMVDLERDTLLSDLPAAKMGQSLSGMNLQSGVSAWYQNAKALIRRYGKEAGEKATDTWVGMPMAPMQDAAKEVKTGVLAPGRATLDESGNEIKAAKPVQLEPPTRQIQPYIAMINKIGDRLGNVTDKDGNVHNAFDQFISMRDGLYQLMNEAPDTATRQQAYRLWQGTQDMARLAESEVTGGKKVYRPALKVANKLSDGRIVIGEPGDLHADIEGGENPDQTQMGFITPEGKFLNRKDAVAWARQNYSGYQGDSEGLEAMAYYNTPGYGAKTSKFTAEFQSAFTKFMSTYKDTEEAASVLRAMMNAKDPGNIAKALTQPGRLKTLQTIKSALMGTPQEPAWDAIVDGFRSNLQADLVKGGRTIRELQARDPELINTLMEKREQQSWLRLSDSEEEIRRSLSSKLAEGGDTAMDNAIQLAQKGSATELAKYVKGTGGVDGEFATSLRRGVWQDILNSAKKIDEKTGEETIVPSELNRAIQRYMIGPRRAALDPAMRPEDWEMLSLIRRYSAVVGADVSSIGGSMQAGQLVSHLSDVHGMISSPARFMLSALKMLNNKLMSNILATPVGIRMMKSAANAKSIPSAVNLLSHIVSFQSEKELHPQRQQPASIQGEGQ